MCVESQKYKFNSVIGSFNKKKPEKSCWYEFSLTLFAPHPRSLSIQREGASEHAGVDKTRYSKLKN